MNARLGSLSLLVGALTFLLPLTVQAAPVGIDHSAPPPPAAPPVWNPPTGPILSPAPQPPTIPAPDPGDTSQDASADQDVPAPESEISPAAAMEAPTFQWTHYSMDDLAQSMQSLDAPAEPGHYTMDDIAQSGL